MELKTRLASFVLGLVLSAYMFSCPPSFSQEGEKETVERKVKVRVDARYPDLARQIQLFGKVRIEVIVSPDGRVKNTRLIGGNPILANAALDAIKQWRYEPGPKETIGIVEVDFKDPRK